MKKSEKKPDRCKLYKKKLKLLYRKIIISFFLKIYPKPIIKTIKDKSFRQFNIKLDNKLYNIFELKWKSFYNKNDITAYITKNILTKHHYNLKNTTQLIVLTKKYKKMKLLLMERQN